uniref:Uncharacterized protein n=1 Tax=Acrobeloides nanus TaxID=290746 RepID=A0A914EJX5_9BILA
MSENFYANFEDVISFDLSKRIVVYKRQIYSHQDHNNIEIDYLPHKKLFQKQESEKNSSNSLCNYFEP